MAVVVNGKLVLDRHTKTKPKINQKDSIIWKSFHFIWPSALAYPLYVWYVIKEMGDKIRVWIHRRNSNEQTECTIRKSIITLNYKNDYKESRIYMPPLHGANQNYETK